MADHNDPNAVNSIFSDVDVSAADLYDLFGFPSDDRTGGEKVVIALTFASVPKAGVLDRDMLYRLRIYPNERVVRPSRSAPDLDSLLKYFEAVKAKYLRAKAAEIRVVADREGRVRLDFVDFVGGRFSSTIDINRAVPVDAPSRQPNKVF